MPQYISGRITFLVDGDPKDAGEFGSISFLVVPLISSLSELLLFDELFLVLNTVVDVTGKTEHFDGGVKAIADLF